MKQVLHIFAKDARHQWPEILLSLSFMACLAFTPRSHWSTGAYGGISYSAFGLFSNLPQFLVLVIPLGWWLLISPLIHDESLVGDRQFWITRPYQWQKLLAAKVLFLLVFVYVPLFLAQLAVLGRAGFSPFRCIPGLLYGLSLLTCAFVLPLLTFATVTRTFARMTLAILGTLACAITIGLLAQNATTDRVAVRCGDLIALCLMIGICIAVVIVQYARRRTRISWILLGVLVVLLAAFEMGGAPDNDLIRSTYPPSSHGPAPVHFDYRVDWDGTGAAFVAQKPDRVLIAVPVQVSGVAEGSIVIPDYLRATLQAPDGSRWTSVWQPSAGDKFFPGEKPVNERFTMPRAIYDSLKGKSLNVDLEIALTEARAGSTNQVLIPAQDFAVAGLGFCTPLLGFLDHANDIGGLVCRAPLRQPQLTMITTAWTEAPCATASENAKSAIQGAAWVGALERHPAEFGIVPVWSSYIGFTNQQKIENNQIVGMRKLCPGTPISFTAYGLSRRFQTSLSISGFHIPELTQGQMTVINQN